MRDLDKKEAHIFTLKGIHEQQRKRKATGLYNEYKVEITYKLVLVGREETFMRACDQFTVYMDSSEEAHAWGEAYFKSLTPHWSFKTSKRIGGVKVSYTLHYSLSDDMEGN